MYLALYIGLPFHSSFRSRLQVSKYWCFNTFWQYVLKFSVLVFKCPCFDTGLSPPTVIARRLSFLVLPTQNPAVSWKGGSIPTFRKFETSFLVGGFTHFLNFYPYFGEDFQFEHIFQMGWFNHQPFFLGWKKSRNRAVCFFFIFTWNRKGFLNLKIIQLKSRNTIWTIHLHVFGFKVPPPEN